MVTNRYGVRVEPPQPVETVAPPGGDPHVPPGTYQPPTGGPVSWRDVELPADGDLPPPRPLALVSDLPDWLDDSDDPGAGLVYDSYRHRS